MTVCDYCKKETIISYTCIKCRGKFCSTHRLPENHECPSIDHSNSEVDDVSSSIEEYKLDSYITTEQLSLDGTEELPEEFDNDQVKLYEKSNNKEKSVLFLFMVTLLTVSLVVNGYLYLNHFNLNKNYLTLYDSSTILQSYYDNLTNQYNDLRSEYSLLNSLYLGLSDDYSDLQKEYDQIISYNKSIQLISMKTITIQPKENHTEKYKIPFSGFVYLNYNSSGDAFVWVGSTKIEGIYYSRNPPFPQTSSKYNFTVPALPDLVLYFVNPNEFDSIEITYSIIFTY